jgi:hypothetical protein
MKIGLSTRSIVIKSNSLPPKQKSEHDHARRQSQHHPQEDCLNGSHRRPHACDFADLPARIYRTLGAHRGLSMAAATFSFANHPCRSRRSGHFPLRVRTFPLTARDPNHIQQDADRMRTCRMGLAGWDVQDRARLHRERLPCTASAFAVTRPFLADILPPSARHQNRAEREPRTRFSVSGWLPSAQ